MNKKTAIIVGGGRSLGAYLSKHLAQNGYDVAVIDLDGENAASVAAEINAEGGRAVGYRCDATDESAVIDTFAKIRAELGNIYLMVYVAGIAKSRKITDFELSDFNLCVNVNLTGYFLCAREAARIMIAEGTRGRIIQINSKSGKEGSKFNSGYSSSKFGGWGLTQSIALDLAPHGITVNALMLGNLLNSDMFRSLVPSYAKKLGIPEEEVVPYYQAKTPMNRGCEFSDVAAVLTFYASEGASYCTGQAINITGGQVMH
ncbi:MAG: sorbitol-6-phosphate dehydrogenase [Clostridia bacterium]|nr:sorbitol-6-phosphate dehydrogenase [Clostridia bacterium]